MMRISELIEQLKEIKNKEGDLIIQRDDDVGPILTVVHPEDWWLDQNTYLFID